MTNKLNIMGAVQVMKRKRSYSRVTREALSILGKLIRLGRAKQGMTAQDLADRAGVSRTTLQSIEKGRPGTEIGTVFEVAALIGVRLFDASDRSTLAVQKALLEERLTLLPQAVRPSVRKVDDDF